MLRNRAHIIAIPLLLLAGQQALAQNHIPRVNHHALADFVAGFEAVRLPFNVDPPSLNIEAYPLVTDPSQLQLFLKPHGLGYNAEVRAGHVLYEDTAFVALTVLILLGEEPAWYLITFSQDGKALDKGRIGAFYEIAGSRHEHWAELTQSLQVEHTSLYRFYNQEGSEQACTQSRWQWQLQENGYIEKSEEVSEDCSQ